MSLVQIEKPKIELKIRSKDLKASEVLRQAEGKFIQCKGAMCKPGLNEEKEYCVIGVLAFEKGARADDSHLIKVTDYNDNTDYYLMKIGERIIGMGKTLRMYNIPDEYQMKIYGLNDTGHSFSQVADFLEENGY